MNQTYKRFTNEHYMGCYEPLYIEKLKYAHQWEKRLHHPPGRSSVFDVADPTTSQPESSR